MFLPSLKPYTILSIIFAWFLGVCYGFVLLSSAAGQNGDLNFFQTTNSILYNYHSTLLLNGKDNTLKNVGFYINADLLVQTIWAKSKKKIVKLELKNPRLNIKSRKAPSPDGFIEHSSKLDEFKSHPFYLVWENGKIDQILLAKSEPISLANLKKGIASLFQFQLLDVVTNETDASGYCSTTYTSLDPLKFRKTKTNCLSTDLPYKKNYERILDTIVDSFRETSYELSSDSDIIKSINSKETHQMYLGVKDDIGNYVEANQILTYVKSDSNNQKIEKETDNVEEILLDLLNQNGVVYNQETLITERDQIFSDETKSFVNILNEVRDNLKAKYLGSLQSAKAFIRLVSVARNSRRDDLLKAVESKKNQKILPQIYDVLGYVQSQDSHEIVMKKLYFDNEDHLDLNERYLWALSMSSQPNPDIIVDLMNRYRKNLNIPEKIKETLLLTMASMAHRLSILPNQLQFDKTIKKVEEMILNGLDYAKDEDRFKFLRALKNLKSKTTIPKLLEILKTGSKKEGVLVLKAIKSLNPLFWDSHVINSAKNAFFQLNRIYDTSSRTLAADILLEAQPINDQTVSDLIYYLQSNDSSFEIKQYVYQRLHMLMEEDEGFKDKIQTIVLKDKYLNNYSVLAPRGLSTALKRRFISSSSTNGSLLTIQEMNSGIVKRGIVNIMFEQNREISDLISLGIFSGGLNSFISSNSDGTDDETATAGMDLTVLGTQIRPFVFFNGQGELMGHVWSGTASEMTTAYQALSLLQDHLEYLRLGSGFIAELNLKGALSFDLSGRIEISLWNRNAESLVEKSAGLLAVGSIKIDTSFVRSQVEFSASIEPKLNLQTDIDFSSNMNLCMRLMQPETTYRYNTFKIERIPGSKHKLRIATYKKNLVPGKTYSLNRKNNEMCSAMFK